MNKDEARAIVDSYRTVISANGARWVKSYRRPDARLAQAMVVSGTTPISVAERKVVNAYKNAIQAIERMKAGRQ
jgi:hypothetical protein